MSAIIGWPRILIHRLKATNGKSDQAMEMKQKIKKTMSQLLLAKTSETRTCLLTRTQKPAIISAHQNKASSGLPSSTETAPPTGRPKMLSHVEKALEQPSTSQISGSQS